MFQDTTRGANTTENCSALFERCRRRAPLLASLSSVLLLLLREECHRCQPFAFVEAELRWAGRPIRVPLHRVGLLVQSVLVEQVHHLTHGHFPGVEKSQLVEKLNELRDADQGWTPRRESHELRRDLVVNGLHRPAVVQGAEYC